MEESLNYIVSQGAGNIKIVNSFKITDRNVQKAIIMLLYARNPWWQVRTLNSYLYEWRAHNLLYKLKLFQERTKDVDLNTNETIFKKIIYNILGRF